MKKQSKFIRNPLSIALGYYFSEERKPSTSKEIADVVGIGDSFYRMIEIGSAFIHPSKALDITKAFSKQGIKLGALSTYLVVTQIYESNKNSIDEIKETLEELNTDEKLKKLLTIFNPVWEYLGEYENLRDLDSQIKAKINEKMKDLLYTDQVYNEIKEFLCCYDDYAISILDKYSKNESELNTIFYELPTIYLDYVKNFILQTTKLPVRINFNEIRIWENDNIDNFSSIYALVSRHEIITHEKVLEDYKYKYLWGKNFHEARFIFLDDGIEASQIKSNFITNLKKSYGKILPRDFDEKMNKIIIKTCPATNNSVNTILGDKKANNNYDTFWVFTFSQSNEQYGFVSNAELDKKIKNYEIFYDGKSLNYTETKTKFEIIETLWNSID